MYNNFLQSFNTYQFLKHKSAKKTFFIQYSFKITDVFGAHLLEKEPQLQQQLSRSCLNPSLIIVLPKSGQGIGIVGIGIGIVKTRYPNQDKV